MGDEKSRVVKLLLLNALSPIVFKRTAFDISSSFILAFAKLDFPIVSIVKGNINLLIVTSLNTSSFTVLTPSWIVNTSLFTVFMVFVSNVYNHTLLLLSIILSIWSSVY